MSELKILGIGNPFLDYLIEISDQYLQRYVGKKGGMVAIDHDQFLKIITDGDHKPLVSIGGSGVNVMRSLAKLGYSCALAGKIGKDAAGTKIKEKLQAEQIESFLSFAKTPTGQVLCLITPDKERTMRSFLGAAQEMTAQDLTEVAFKNRHLVHIEGYSLLYPGVTERAMQLAKASGAMVSFDIGSFEMAELFRERILSLIPQYVDILFANAIEVKTLIQCEPKEGCQKLTTLCPTVIVSMGGQGCYAANGNELIHFPAFQVPVVDTTGAGDLFASGFLHGILQGASLIESARFGCSIGAAVVQVAGVELSDQAWEQLKRDMCSKSTR